MIDDDKLLIFVHIGKCGGASVFRAINESLILQKNFERIERVHVSKPPILQKAKYLIAIRNPIKRAISAFNWRYKLVVTDGKQKTRFEHEYDILKKYESLNALAESLYIDKTLNHEVSKEFRLIHHLNEDIAFYISELLNKIDKEQIYGILATETLDDDISRIFKLNISNRMHENYSKTSFKQKHLSAIAYSNLRRFLTEDYTAIEKLLRMYESTHMAKDKLLA